MTQTGIFGDLSRVCTIPPGAPLPDRVDVALLSGDAGRRLSEIPDGIADALVTDPPGGLNFMRQGWDADHGGRQGWVQRFTPLLQASLRVLKPGAHALVWAHPRTSHWTATALEDAGFEIRDVLTHVRANGRPKGLDVDRALRDRGLAPEVVGRHTTLKAATEHWILARTAFEGSALDVVMSHGTGALNVGACLTEAPPPVLGRQGAAPQGPTGRFPTNFLMTHAPECEEGRCVPGCPVRAIDEQSGVTRSGSMNVKQSSGSDREGYQGTAHGAESRPSGSPMVSYGDAGGASRFFPRFRYAPAPSTSERDAGLGDSNTHPTVKPIALMRWLVRLVTPVDGLVLDPFAGSGTTGCAAVLEGRRFIGIEKDPEHLSTAQRRINYWSGYR